MTALVREFASDKYQASLQNKLSSLLDSIKATLIPSKLFSLLPVFLT